MDRNPLARFCDLFLRHAQSAAHLENTAIRWCGAKADGTGGRFAVVGCSRFERTGLVFVTPFVNGRTHAQTALCDAGGPDAAAHGVGRACALFRMAEACGGQFHAAMRRYAGAVQRELVNALGLLEAHFFAGIFYSSW